MHHPRRDLRRDLERGARGEPGAHGQRRADLATQPETAGITYVPDFVANAGGVIQVHGGVAGWSEAETLAAVDRIGTRVGELLETAGTEGITPVEAALRRADAALGRTVAR